MKNRHVTAMMGALALVTLLPQVSHASIEGTKANLEPGQEICVVDTPAVEQKFRGLFLERLSATGHTTRIVATVQDCPVVMTFTAQYAMSGGYRRVLKLSSFAVFRSGAPVASVRYRFSHRPFGNGTVEEVIDKMLETVL